MLYDISRCTARLECTRTQRHRRKRQKYKAAVYTMALRIAPINRIAAACRKYRNCFTLLIYIPPPSHILRVRTVTDYNSYGVGYGRSALYHLRVLKTSRGITGFYPRGSYRTRILSSVVGFLNVRDLSIIFQRTEAFAAASRANRLSREEYRE